MKKFKFELEGEDRRARLGRITTAHGEIETPAFMAVGTRGSIKTLSPDEVKGIGAEIVLGNTYHLYLRPGTKVIARHGGLHKFMGWDGPILTDSGGFQVFSLGFGSKRLDSRLRGNDEREGGNDKERSRNDKRGGGNDKEVLVKIKDDGVEFRSHIDGSKHFFTPESVVKMQKEIGADIIMAFDECAPANSTHEYAKEALARTHKWAEKCLATHKKIKPIYGYEQALFGIVQGVTYKDLREESARFISGLGFDGVAIGGLAVGETEKVRNKILDITEPYLPKGKPRYLMGVGFPKDILDAVERGMDMFDCVLPTRLGRNGTVWTYKGKLNLLNSKHLTDLNPVEKRCDCYGCLNFSRSYITHLIREGEILGIRLTSLHNLRFVMRFMDDIRDSIAEGKFQDFKKKFLREFH